MRKTLAVGCAAAALTFGGAGIAQADIEQGTPPSSTTTILADDHNEHHDNSGLWGLTGLLGLAGLAGLARRRTNDVNAHPAATRRPTV